MKLFNMAILDLQESALSLRDQRMNLCLPLFSLLARRKPFHSGLRQGSIAC